MMAIAVLREVTASGKSARGEGRIYGHGHGRQRGQALLLLEKSFA